MNQPKGTIIKGMEGEDLDLSEQWVKVCHIGTMMYSWSNLPNNIAGDQAFEYDFDGSERKKWIEYLEELKRLGTYGDLVLLKISWVYLPELDGPNPYPWNEDGPKSSPVFMIFDVSPENEKAPE